MTADLFEGEGWSVWFLGSGVPNDEILEMLGKVKPDVLCIYGTQATGVPNVRRLIETTREIGAYEQMQILVTGGVFNRAGARRGGAGRPVRPRRPPGVEDRPGASGADSQAGPATTREAPQAQAEAQAQAYGPEEASGQRGLMNIFQRQRGSDRHGRARLENVHLAR